MTFRYQLIFSWIDEDSDVGDKEVMVAKLAMHSSFCLYRENPGQTSTKSHRVEIKLLLPQQGKKKKEDCIWII